MRMETISLALCGGAFPYFKAPPTAYAFTSPANRGLSPKLLESLDDEYETPIKKGFFANFFEELDAFVDDATSRRLGNGAQYYGKRKSSFYGKNDTKKKKDRDVADPMEDYRGPNNAGYFKWIPDDEGQLKPVTRLKEVNIEKKVNRQEI